MKPRSREEYQLVYDALKATEGRCEMNPTRSFQTHPDEEPKSWKGVASGWMRDQGASTVLLTAILGAIGWGVQFAMTKAIPAHLEQIQAGYEKIEKTHTETELANRQAYREALREVLDHEREMRGLDRKKAAGEKAGDGVAEN